MPAPGVQPDRPAGERPRDARGHFLKRDAAGGEAAGGGRDGSPAAAGGGPAGTGPEQPAAAAGSAGVDQGAQSGAAGAAGLGDVGSLLGGLFGAPPPSAPPGDVDPIEEGAAGGESGQQPLQTPAYYEYVRTFLVAGSGAIAGVAHWDPLAMTDFEATCLSLGLTRYAERQPGSGVARLVEESDLAA